MTVKTDAPAEGVEKEPVPGTKEYDDAMVARFAEGTGAVEKPEGSDKELPKLPDGGVDKFFNKETGDYNWQAHAQELQFKIDQKAPAKKEDAPPAEKKEGDAPADDAAVKNVVEAAGLKMDDLRDQIVTKGVISDEAKAALVKQGIPQDLIEEYVDSVRFRIEAMTQKAMDYAGGKDGWQALHDWAAGALSDKEKASYNAMLQSTDEGQWRVAIDTLTTKMKASVPGGREGRLVTGDRIGGGEVSGFRSKREQSAAIQDPRYDKDPAYRAAVQRRIGVSKYEDEFRF